ncbi:MAG TPA: hypothetical protein VKV15_00620 [Bryobacteraceae bacterium]|nr:hypothetical protein [Bryobacteraceae bacterium]
MNLVRMPLPLLTLRFASAQQPSRASSARARGVHAADLQQLTPEEKSHLQANRHVNRAEWIKGRRIQLVCGKEDRADLGWDKPHAPHRAVVDERLKAAAVAPNQGRRPGCGRRIQVRPGPFRLR